MAPPPTPAAFDSAATTSDSARAVAVRGVSRSGRCTGSRGSACAAANGGCSDCNLLLVTTAGVRAPAPPPGGSSVAAETPQATAAARTSSSASL